MIKRDFVGQIFGLFGRKDGRTEKSLVVALSSYQTTYSVSVLRKQLIKYSFDLNTVNKTQEAYFQR